MISAKLTSRAVTDGDVILATANIPVFPERVFRALTTDEAERWWGSADSYRVTDWMVDVREDGLWSLVVRGPDRSIYPASGKFLIVEAPSKIILTMRYDWDCPILGRRDTVVTFSLDPIAIGTRVTVRHDGFDGLRKPADGHAAGWECFLGWLTDYLSKDSQL